MSIFDSIISKIFTHESAVAQTMAQAKITTPSKAPSAGAAPPPVGGSGSSTTTTPPAVVDVEAVLTELSAKAGQPLDWRHSIVDLMKLLDLDSSLGARKALAQELHYSGDPNDSAPMNVWLHKQVMVKLAENGGRVPRELQS